MLYVLMALKDWKETAYGWKKEDKTIVMIKGFGEKEYGTFQRWGLDVRDGDNSDDYGFEMGFDTKTKMLKAAKKWMRNN